MKNVVGSALVATGILVSACGDDDPSNGANALSTVTVSLEGGDFTGNSVRILGTRVDGADDPLSADSKYRCDSSFDACFNLDGSNPTVTQTGLCPTKDVPNGNWTFVYKIYSEEDCGGTLLNPIGLSDPNNFQCFDSHDLFTQDHPNKTYQEPLLPGLNENSIVCATTNAEKDFSFTSCAILSDSTNELILDCGCVPDGPDCDCGSLTSGVSGNLQDDVGATCTINPDADPACAIVCCATGFTDCDSGCFDLQTDESHCGTCGVTCSLGQTCVAGVCTP